MQNIRVRNIDHLKELINNEKTDFFICLDGGLRSSKTICPLDDNKFLVFNEIDGTEEEFTEQELMDKDFTNIGEAMTAGALYCYDG